jgi:phospholipase C
MPILSNVRITFNTHDDNKDWDTVLHVFVKNRLNTSLTSETNRSFLENLLAYKRYLPAGDLWDLGDTGSNPYLAVGINLAQGVEFEDPSLHVFDLAPISNTISVDDIVLPVVNVHILPNGHDRWIFDYTITLFFSDGLPFYFSSKDAGIKGNILDQDNRDYSGICIENPRRTRPIPAPTKPDTDAVLKKVTLEFATHDDNKDADTRLNVHIVNRLDASSSQDIAIGKNLSNNQEFADPSTHGVTWSAEEGTLAPNSIQLRDIVLPVVYITIHPNGNDRWIFDYRLTFEFGHPDDQKDQGKRRIFRSRTNGIILDQDNNIHSGAYQGDPFPTVAPPTAPPLTGPSIQHISPPKAIPLSLLGSKFDQFINLRQGPPADQDPPLTKLRLHSTAEFGPATPESYLDLRSITAVRGTQANPAGLDYVSSPISFGQLNKWAGLADSWLRNIKSNEIKLTVDRTQPFPLVKLYVKFDTSGPFDSGGPPEIIFRHLQDVHLTEFSISLLLTLAVAYTTDDTGHKRGAIDLMSWFSEIDNLTSTEVHVPDGPLEIRYTGTFLGEPLDVTTTAGPGSFKDSLFDRVLDISLTTGSALDYEKKIRTEMRDRILDQLRSPDPFTNRSRRDDINAFANSWLLGGVVDGDDPSINNDVQSLNVDGDDVKIAYSGPQVTFVPKAPADWPSGHDFSPGTLANIHHLVVLTMENRSFDHMLGYLSLPVSKGGRGRTDVDGLTGGQSNTYNGVTYPSVPLTDTFFAPEPPHGYEPVHQAINEGKMDGFVKSYAEAHGSAVAGNIMKHQTAATVPVYDALARDFALGHRWFASHPGPTFPNRFYELTGRLNLDTRGFWEFDNSSPRVPVFTKTIFDYLTEANISWTYFEHVYCFLRFFERHTFDATNIASLKDPTSGFFALAKAGRLPSVSFIDPHFVEIPPHSNDDDSPSDIKDGQDLVSKVVEAVVTSPSWNDTLLVIIYDEHGGFYDHVAPPLAPKVSEDIPIETYGVRVPAFVISPWVGAGAVFGRDAKAAVSTGQGEPAAGPLPSLYFDHTSILKTIARCFLSKNPPDLGARYATANDLSVVVGKTLRKTQFLPFVRYHLVYHASQKALDVEGGNAVPGAVLRHSDQNATAAQDFSFEEAGDGFVYIRTHQGNLYVTVDVPDLVSATTGTTLPAAHGIKQDVKYKPVARAGTVPTKLNPDYQKWKLTPVGNSAAEKDLYVISNAFFPDKVLQPLNPTQSGVGVVLGAKAEPAGAVGSKNAWKVTGRWISE